MFPANAARGWLLKRGLPERGAALRGGSAAPLRPVSAGAAHEMDAEGQSDTMLRTAVTSALLGHLEEVDPALSCLLLRKQNKMGEAMGAPRCLTLPLKKGSL